MKKLFLLCLAFCALAVCNCKHDISPNYVTKPENEQSTQKPETLPPEVVPPEVVPPEIVLPETKPPEVTPPEVVPPEIIPPETKPPEVTPPEVVPPEIIPPETKPPEVTPPEVVPPEIKPPEEGTQEDEPEEGETTEIETPVEIPEPALLQINELRTEYEEYSKKTEYIEFKVIKGGSMEGLFLYIIMNNAQDIFVYIFPEIDVETGEYITLHLRNLDKDNCFNELRDDLTISGGRDTCPIARDLWVTGNNKLLNKTSIVYLQDENGRIMDAIVMNEKPSATWNSNQAHFAEITEQLFNAGMWQSADGQKPTPLDAVDTSKIATYLSKSISRYEGRENTHSANDWYITAINAITPGLPNK